MEEGREVPGGEGVGKAPARVTFKPDWMAEKGPPREEEAGRPWAEGPPLMQAWGVRAEGPVCPEGGRWRGGRGKLWPGQFGLSCRGSNRSPGAGRCRGAFPGTRSCAGVVWQPACDPGYATSPVFHHRALFLLDGGTSIAGVL